MHLHPSLRETRNGLAYPRTRARARTHDPMNLINSEQGEGKKSVNHSPPKMAHFLVLAGEKKKKKIRRMRLLKEEGERERRALNDLSNCPFFFSTIYYSRIIDRKSNFRTVAKRNEPPVVNFTIASYLRLWPTFFSLLASPPFLRPLSQLEPREMVIPLVIRKTYPAPRSRSTRASERSALGKSSLSSKPVKIFLPPAFIRSIFRGFVQGPGRGARRSLDRRSRTT